MPIRARIEGLTRDEVIGTTVEVFRTWELAQWWLKEPKDIFGGRCPLALIEAGNLKKVYEYLVVIKQRRQEGIGVLTA